jgi:hypothetical protein
VWAHEQLDRLQAEYAHLVPPAGGMETIWTDRRVRARTPGQGRGCCQHRLKGDVGQRDDEHVDDHHEGATLARRIRCRPSVDVTCDAWRV